VRLPRVGKLQKHHRSKTVPVSSDSDDDDALLLVKRMNDVFRGRSNRYDFSLANTERNQVPKFASPPAQIAGYFGSPVKYDEPLGGWQGWGL